LDNGVELKIWRALLTGPIPTNEGHVVLVRSNILGSKLQGKISFVMPQVLKLLEFVSQQLSNNEKDKINVSVLRKQFPRYTEADLELIVILE